MIEFYEIELQRYMEPDEISALLAKVPDGFLFAGIRIHPEYPIWTLRFTRRTA